MSFPYGDPSWTNDQLRVHLDRAHNSAKDKWGAYLSDLALAYWNAFKNAQTVLDNIQAFEKARKQQSELFWTVVLPAVAGGFLGGIISLRLKAVLQETGLKFIEHSLLIDTGKAVTSDLAKYNTKQIEAAFQDAVDTHPWKPSATEPAKFAELLRNELLHGLTALDDSLIEAEKSGRQVYRDQMFAFYNSPFIWSAPEEKDLKKWRDELWRPLEVFLWADWANHRDTKYWSKRVMGVIDGPVNRDYVEEFELFDPILDRLIECKVPQHYITLTAPSYRYTRGDTVFTKSAHPFLNILWVRHLAKYYKNTFLGALLMRIEPGHGASLGGPANLSLRPGSYSLM
jgi:hypothetical protein